MDPVEERDIEKFFRMVEMPEVRMRLLKVLFEIDNLIQKKEVRGADAQAPTEGK